MQLVLNPEASWLSELKGLSQNVPMNKFLHVKRKFSQTLGTIYWVPNFTATITNPHNQQSGHYYYSLSTKRETGSESLLSQGPKAV